MAVYINNNRKSPIASVEFTPSVEGNFTVLHARNPGDVDAIRQQLTERAPNQRVLATTSIDGRPALVTQGPRSRDEIFRTLAADNNLREEIEKRGIGAWGIRGILGVVGQGFVLISSQLRRDSGAMLFVVANLAANALAFAVGSQKKEDAERAKAAKQDINQYVAGKTHEPLPGTAEQRAPARQDKEILSPQQKIGAWIRKHSVNIIIGLRMLGIGALFKSGIAAAHNLTGERKKEVTFARMFKEPRLVAQAFKGSATDVKKSRLWASVLTGVGKTIGLTPLAAKNNGVFRAASVLEMFGFGMLARDGWSKKFTTKDLKGFPWSHFNGIDFKHDYFRATGGSLFVTAYLVRFFAKKETQEISMNELFAHASDAIAQVSGEEMPQVVADVAAQLKALPENKDEPYGEIYNRLANDLYRFHNIAFKPDVDAPMHAGKAMLEQDNTTASELSDSQVTPEGELVNQTLNNATTSKSHTAAQTRKRPADYAKDRSHAASHAERAAQAVEETAAAPHYV